MKKKRNVLTWIIWALIVVLAAVVALMAYKQWEYSQSADYYDSLRGDVQPLSWLISSASAEEEVLVQDSDALHYLVESLFAAVTGTTEADERAARENMDEAAELARNAENASYRAVTLPWLKASFFPGDDWTDVPRIVPEGGVLPVYSLEQSYEAMQQNRLGKAFLSLLEPFSGTDFASCLDVSQKICRQWLSEIDHVKLKETNRHYEMWIYAPGTLIDYPIVQCSDNERYLNKLFDGRRNSSGTLFIDYRNLTKLRDPNTLIYGHHMRNKSMFGTLVFYKEQAYFESHPYMLMIDDGQIWLLEMFAGYTTTSEDHCYDIAISSERDKKQFVSEAQRKSNFLADVPVFPADRLVTLSTCAYSFENARYITIGRLIPWWKLPEPEVVAQ